MSDDFRMFEFKVRRCSRTRAHDWTECPYTHPGEKARRRDPRRFHYSGSACPDFRKGSCPRGDACELAHGVFECWLHPSRYRTQLCKDGARCGRRARASSRTRRTSCGRPRTRSATSSLGWRTSSTRRRARAAGARGRRRGRWRAPTRRVRRIRRRRSRTSAIRRGSIGGFARFPAAFRDARRVRRDRAPRKPSEKQRGFPGARLAGPLGPVARLPRASASFFANAFAERKRRDFVQARLAGPGLRERVRGGSRRFRSGGVRARRRARVGGVLRASRRRPQQRLERLDGHEPRFSERF